MADWVLKICLLGDGGVGKTSLVYQFIEGRFSTDFKSTLGVNLLKKTVKIDDSLVTCNIWDLGGQDAYRKLRNLYLEGSNGALVLYDVTNRKSFQNLSDWIDSFKNMRGSRPLVMIGNKIDLPRKVPKEEAEQKCAELENASYLETSAKTGENVEQAFNQLIKDVLAYNKDHAT